jgi:glycosyltransferase involved in cell wall biosynthesis
MAYADCDGRLAEQASHIPDHDMTPEAEKNAPLKILIVTDAWAPQVNGVVRTLEMLIRELTRLGHVVKAITPEGRFSVPLPTYPEIRLTLFQHHALENDIAAFAPDVVHIATEGTLGLAARRICMDHGVTFSTAFHTRFSDYVHARFAFVPEALVWHWLRWFHRPACAVMAATPSLCDELRAHGLANVRLWSRGVDVDQFRPLGRTQPQDPPPVWLYVGRLAVEKNVEAFLTLDLPGTRVVVGEGPERIHLAAKHTQARFLGALAGDDLVRAYGNADVFVFPSRTDTFGLVLLEALACGLSIAAYPVPGPLDVVGGPDGARVAVLDNDLGKACRGALALRKANPEAPRAFALSRSWAVSTQQFLDNALSPAEKPQPTR